MTTIYAPTPDLGTFEALAIVAVWLLVMARALTVR